MAGRICRFNDVELWQRDRKVAVFHHKAKPPIVNDWPTVATGRNWSGGLEQARRMAAGPVDPLTNERLQNLVRAKRGFANEEHGESVGKPKCSANLNNVLRCLRRAIDSPHILYLA